MQQVMEIMQGLQEAMAISKAEQERMQADLAGDELCRTNEELRRGLRNSQGYVMQMIVIASLHQGSSPHRSRSRSWRW